MAMTMRTAAVPHIHLSIRADDSASKPVAMRSGMDQVVTEMWVGEASSWNLLGLTSVTKVIDKDIANDQVFVTFAYKLNGVTLIERVFRVNFDDTLGELVRERTATIGDLE